MLLGLGAVQEARAQLDDHLEGVDSEDDAADSRDDVGGEVLQERADEVGSRAVERVRGGRVGRDGTRADEDSGRGESRRRAGHGLATEEREDDSDHVADLLHLNHLFCCPTSDGMSDV